MAISMPDTRPEGFNARWETDVYRQGKQINRYPFPVFIPLFLSHYGAVADRSKVKVLEVGCGAGNNVWFFAREGYDIHAIEGSAWALDHARRRLADENLAADLRTGDFQNLPYDDASMDFVLDRGSITHNARQSVEASLDEIRRVLKPGGHFFSQMFSTIHRDLKFADDYADNSAARFSDGYFAGIGRTFFADRSVIDAIFGSRFTILALELESHEDTGRGHVSAVWNVSMQK